MVIDRICACVPVGLEKGIKQMILRMISRHTVTAAAVIVATTAMLRAHGQLPAGNWQYQWGDDFSGSTLDQAKWGYNYPWGSTHNHDATMNPSQVVVHDGSLKLIARRTGSGAEFVSGAISTGYNKQTFNGGYIEARVKLPDTPGSWPAFWGLYSGWPPEADIMEYPIDTAAGNGYSQHQYHTAFHYRNSSGGNSAGAGPVNPGGVGDLGGGYHTFGMQWTEDDWVGFYFDGQLVSQFGDNAAIAQMQHMYLILNYAVGGWPGTPNTTEWPVGHSDTFEVDYVRVWQNAAGKTSNWVHREANAYAQWDNATNWSNGSPNLGGVTSSFNTVRGLAEQRIDWQGSRTLSTINLDGNTRYRFGWPDDRLVLAYGESGAMRGTINVAQTTTVEHEIYGRLEFAGGINLNNASSQRLLLSGEVLGGGGDVRINGVGPVVFAGINSYYANTIIDSGAQGSGVAIAQSQQPFGLGGRVIIGEAGNQTNAMLQLENGAVVPNAIGFRGRNTNTPAIVNAGGNNTISGALHIEYGGGTYIVRSDAGLLTLSGVSNRRVAVQTGENMGARTLTLDGDADGHVTGLITNATGSSLSVLKTGSGVWTLATNNTYSGETIVEGGTLVVNGTGGAGMTTVMNEATLSGEGSLVGGLDVQSGGRLSPGQSIGTMTVNSATLAAQSTLEMEIGSAVPGSGHDQLVAGFANIAGNLEVHLVNGFSPSWGDSFDILEIDDVAGGFAEISLPPLGSGLAWDTNDLLLTGTIAVVHDGNPIPGDTDGDGDIDDIDLGTMFANYTGPVGAAGGKTASQGDTDVDGDVDDNDLGNAFANYTGPLSEANVPEPTCLTLLGIGAYVCLCRRPRASPSSRLRAAHRDDQSMNTTLLTAIARR
jgi:autotransporter-associated beta strand protein